MLLDLIIALNIILKKILYIISKYDTIIYENKGVIK